MKSSKILIGFALIAVVGAITYFAYGRATTPRGPNVIILLLDTLRADHLGTYGYERPTSPNLDQFAAENIKFNFAITAAPWTPPSVASILTGQYASSHGLMPPNSRRAALAAEGVLNERLETLPEILKQSGYQTAGVSSNPWINSEFGFTQGFDSFKSIPRAIASEVNDAAFKLIPSLKNQTNPFFLYLHYLDPHDPYEPPGEFATMFKGPISRATYDEKMTSFIELYDGEIRYLDTELGKLFAFLKEHDLYKDSIIVIVGDHGEQFREHGHVGHGKTLYNVEVRVPLLVRLGQKTTASVVDHTVSTVDIFATVLGELGIKGPTQSSLSVSLLDKKRQELRPGVLSEISRNFNQRSFTTYDGRKLIIGSTRKGDDRRADDPTRDIIGLFNSQKEPLELTALTSSEDLVELQTEFRKLFDVVRSLKTGGTGATAKVSSDTLKQLESLGYLQ